MVDRPSTSAVGKCPSTSTVGKRPTTSSVVDRPSTSAVADRPSTSSAAERPSKNAWSTVVGRQCTRAAQPDNRNRSAPKKRRPMNSVTGSASGIRIKAAKSFANVFAYRLDADLTAEDLKSYLEEVLELSHC